MYKKKPLKEKKKPEGELKIWDCSLWGATYTGNVNINLNSMSAFIVIIVMVTVAIRHMTSTTTRERVTASIATTTAAGEKWWKSKN